MLQTLCQLINTKFAAVIFVITEIGNGSVEPQRALFQFGNMIEYSTNRSPADFIGYGNWCGFSGSGEPVDGIDKCCLLHDGCYDQLNSQECRRYFSIAPYVAKYDWSVENNSIVCNKETNGKCTYGICECDRAAAVCFNNNQYNPDNKGQRFIRDI